MDARTNLAVQLSIIARSRFFLSTCGGLAWLAPFLGVPTVAVYDTDHLLAPHLLVARQAAAVALPEDRDFVAGRQVVRLAVRGNPVAHADTAFATGAKPGRRAGFWPSSTSKRGAWRKKS